MPEKTLALTFRNQMGNTVSMTVDNIKDDITDAEVKTAMELIIDKNIFESTGGDLVSVASAQIVTRTVQELSVR